MFIDIHSHINHKNLIIDLENVISRAKAQGVEKIVCVGSDYDSSLKAIELSDKFECVFAAIGVHPNEAYEFDDKAIKLLHSAKENTKIVAIGEIGLDYYDLDWQIEQAKIKDPKLNEITKEQFVEKQKEVFIKQIEIANSIGLPIMIHMRDSTSDTLKILESNKSFVEFGGLIHCYSGSLETTNRIYELGFYVSVGGAITFKNSRIMPKVLEEVGIERVTLETDCPFLCPEPYRGQKNEPKNIPLIAQRIAQLTNKSIDEIEYITTQNCLKVFPRLNNGKF